MGPVSKTSENSKFGDEYGRARGEGGRSGVRGVGTTSSGGGGLCIIRGMFLEQLSFEKNAHLDLKNSLFTEPELIIILI